MQSGGPADAVSSARGCDAGGCVLALPDPDTLALAVATAVLAEARLAVRLRGRFNLAVAGGATPRPAYELLGRTPFAERFPWESTHVFWGDERWVEPDDARSNERMVREALLSHVPVTSEQVHPMRCPGQVAGGGEGTDDTSLRAAEAARDYEALLRADSVAMDLVLLGLGEDGHTASLFPGADALAEMDRWVVAVLQDVADGAANAGGEPLWRVTLTASYINRAACVLFLVCGAGKAGVLGQVLTGGTDSGGSPLRRLPAQAIRPASGRLWWFVDEAAAAELDRGRLWWPR